MNVESFIASQFESISSKSNKQPLHLAFIGTSAVLQESILLYIKKHHIHLELIIDFETNLFFTKELLKKYGFFNIKMFAISNEFKSKKKLSKQLYDNLRVVCQTLNISHFILDFNFQEYNIFFDFLLGENYPFLINPIFSISRLCEKDMISFYRRYNKLISSKKAFSSNVSIMSSYFYHPGYNYVKKIINEIVREYQVPITYINMQVLFDEKQHDIFSFLGLFSDMLEMNASVFESSVRLNRYQISDNQISLSDSDSYLTNSYVKSFQFYHKKQVLGNAHLRFESVSSDIQECSHYFDIWIHIGSLLRIHMVSDYSENFDIHIYRNNKILKGKKYEKVSIYDLIHNQDVSDLISIQVSSCNTLFQHFFSNTLSSHFYDYRFLVDLLHDWGRRSHIKRSYRSFCYFDSYSCLKKLSYQKKLSDTKELKKQFCKKKFGNTFGVVMNHITDNSVYEVYLYVTNEKEIVSMLLYRTYQSYFTASIYYFYLRYNVVSKKLVTLFQRCTKNEQKFYQC